MPDKPWLPTPWSGRELDPFFRGFRTQLDSLFEDWFGRSMGGTLAPRVDVSETNKDVTLKVELPGVEEKDIEVSLSGSELTIKGEKKSEQEEKKDGENGGRVFHRVERSFGAFQRSKEFDRCEPRDFQETSWIRNGQNLYSKVSGRMVRMWVTRISRRRLRLRPRIASLASGW